MKREKALAKNTIIIGFGTFLPKLASIITLPIVTGFLTKAEYGTYDLLLTLIALVLPLATLQIQTAAFRFLVQIRDNKEECSRVITNIVIFTIVCSIIPIMTIFVLIKNYSAYTRLLICLYFLFDIILQTFQQITRGLGKNTLYSASTILNSAINMVLIYVLIEMCNWGLPGVVGAITVANFCASLFLFYRAKLFNLISFKLVSKRLTKEMIVYSWPLIPNNLSSWIMTLSDRLLLSMFLGVEVNAVYAVAKKIPNLLTAVQSTFSLAWQENASLSADDSDIDGYYSQMFNLVFDLVIGSCAALIGVSPILFALLIRGNYIEAYYQMPILFIALTFTTLSSYLAGIYIADKRTKEIGITTTIAAAINLVIDFILIPTIGMWAASLSTLIGYLFLFVYRIIDLEKYHKLIINYPHMLFWILVLVLLSILSFINNTICNFFLLVLGLVVFIYLNRALICKLLNKLLNHKKVNETQK